MTRYDIGSYGDELPFPGWPPDPIAAAAANAGFELSFVDDVFRAATGGKSFTELILKEFTGNWGMIDRNILGLADGGGRLGLLGANVTENVAVLGAYWTGPSADAFQHHVKDLVAPALRNVCDYMRVMRAHFQSLSDLLQVIAGLVVDVLDAILGDVWDWVFRTTPYIGAVKTIADAVEIAGLIADLRQTIEDFTKALELLLGITQQNSPDPVLQQLWDTLGKLSEPWQEGVPSESDVIDIVPDNAPETPDPEPGPGEDLPLPIPPSVQDGAKAPNEYPTTPDDGSADKPPEEASPGGGDEQLKPSSNLPNPA